MPRRVSLPGAAELFRAVPAEPQKAVDDHHPSAAASPEAASPRTPSSDPNGLPTDQLTERSDAQSAEPAATAAGQTKPATKGRGSGRVRHEEKITVYVSSDELLDLERARLSLRAEHGMAVDRGRIVREALALAIGDLKDRGPDSDLVRRLSR